MLNFADELLQHACCHGNPSQNDLPNIFTSERISIVHFDHAIELIMKAYLLKEGYQIYEIDKNKINEGIKKDAKLCMIINKNKTMDFMQILEIFSKRLKLIPKKKENITKFHKLRNEIQHRSLNIRDNKHDEINKIKPVIQSIYQLAFQDRPCPI